MKKFTFLTLILAIILTGCSKFDEVSTNETSSANPIVSTTNQSTGIASMSDLNISNNFNWRLIKTLDVEIALPDDDASRLLYIYSQDGKRLYFKGHPEDASNVIRTKITVPTSESVVMIKYGAGENYPIIGADLNGLRLSLKMSSTLKSSLKTGGGSDPEFDCLTLWALDDNNPGNLYYATLTEPVVVHTEGDIEGLQDSEDMESLAIDSNGDMYFINVKNSSKLYRIPYDEIDKNPATPVNAIYIGNTGITGNDNKITNLTFIDDELYGIGVRSEKVYRINKNSAYVTHVATLNRSFWTSGLTVAGDGTVYLLYTKNNGDESELWKFNSFPSGDIVKVMNIAGSKKVESLAAHPNGFLYAADDFKWFKLDPINLTTEVVVDYLSDIEGIDFYWDKELDCVNNGGDCDDDGDYNESTFGGFKFEYDGMLENQNGTSTWTYTVTGVAPEGPTFKDLSHWVLALCEDEHTVIDGDPSGYEVNTDPTLNVYGIKWDEGINKEGGTMTFSFTLDNQYDVEPVVVAFKAGNNLHYCTIFGPSCDETPDPEPEVTGTFAVEDLWPGKGDYDINDLVVEYDFDITKDNNENIEHITATFTIRAFGAGLHNGFGFEFPGVDPEDIVSVTGYDIVNTTAYSLAANGVENGQTNATFIVYDDAYRMMQHPGSGIGVNTDKPAPYVDPVTITMEIEFADEAVTYSELNIGEFNPFIVVDQNRDMEVHLPDYEPTSLASSSYFGTYDDDTNPSEGRYYKTNDNLFWAINIPARFDYPVEKQVIIGAHLHFAEWAQSDGVDYADWYKDLAGYRNASVIY